MNGDTHRHTHIFLMATYVLQKSRLVCISYNEFLRYIRRCYRDKYEKKLFAS